MMRTISAEQTARNLIQNYGWRRARHHAETEAVPHSPTGNLDGFWSEVLVAIDNFYNTTRS